MLPHLKILYGTQTDKDGNLIPLKVGYDGQKHYRWNENRELEEFRERKSTTKRSRHIPTKIRLRLGDRFNRFVRQNDFCGDFYSALKEYNRFAYGGTIDYDDDVILLTEDEYRKIDEASSKVRIPDPCGEREDLTFEEYIYIWNNDHWLNWIL